VASVAARSGGASGAAVHPFTSGLIAFALAWAFVAAGETLYGDLDGATDLAAIAADGGRFGAGALLELLAAALLAAGSAGVLIALRAASPRLATIGAWMTFVSAACLGAFAMFHLFLLGMANDVANRVGLNGFLLGPLSSEPGLWGVPILWILLGCPVGLLLLATAAARSRMAPWWPALLIVVSVVLHLGGFSGATEIISHGILAASLAWLAIALMRPFAATASTAPRLAEAP